MNARLTMKLRAIKVTPESIRAHHWLRKLKLTTDDGVTYRLRPQVLCDRELRNWTLNPSTVTR